MKIKKNYFVRVTDQELSQASEVFWDIFMVENDRDHFSEFAQALGCSRHRAKQVYYMILLKKGVLQDQRRREKMVRLALASQVKKLLEAKGVTKSLWEIQIAAEDAVEEKELRRREGAIKC